MDKGHHCKAAVCEVKTIVALINYHIAGMFGGVNVRLKFGEAWTTRQIFPQPNIHAIWYLKLIIKRANAFNTPYKYSQKCLKALFKA